MVGIHSTLIFISPLFYFKPFQTPLPTYLSLSLSPFPSFSSTMNPSREINGVQTSPLKLNNGAVSNLSKKPTSTTTTTITSTSSSSSVSSSSHRPPVIIYTHSPKIIHTRACDFMALVQKLTGLSRSSDDDSNNPTPSSPNNDDCSATLNKKRKTNSIEKKRQELSEPSFDDHTLRLSPQQGPSVSPATDSFEFNPPPSDMPLFMQGFASEFFDLPNAIYKYPELPGSSALPNINGATSTFSEI